MTDEEIKEEIKEENNASEENTVPEEPVKEENVTDKEEEAVPEEKTEEKQEDKVRKDVVLESKVLDQKGDFYDPIDIDDITSCVDKINEKRAVCVSIYESNEKLRKLMLGIALAIITVALVITIVNPALLFTAFIATLMYLVLAYILKRQNTRKSDTALNEYLIEYGKISDSYIYAKNFLISDLSLSYRTKLGFDEVKKINIYKEAVSSATRDYVVGRMAGIDFYVTDCAYKKEEEKKRLKTISVGKLFKFNLRSKEEGRLIIYLSALRENNPTNIDELKEVSVNGLKEGFEVYTSFKDYSKFFSSSFIAALNEFTPNDLLEGICVVIDDKHVYAFLEYADAIMIPPFKEDLKEEKLNQYSKDVQLLINMILPVSSLKEVEKFDNK